MASAATAEKLHGFLAAAVADPNQAPGLIFAAAERSGKLLAHDAVGVRQVGSSKLMDKDMLCWMASCTKVRGARREEKPLSKVLNCNDDECP